MYHSSFVLLELLHLSHSIFKENPLYRPLKIDFLISETNPLNLVFNTSILTYQIISSSKKYTMAQMMSNKKWEINITVFLKKSSKALIKIRNYIRNIYRNIMKMMSSMKFMNFMKYLRFFKNSISRIFMM